MTLRQYGHSVSPKSKRCVSETLRAIVCGAAVGDALGVPYEFMRRDTFECAGMVGGGAHGMPAGTFSDDASLLLATCDSIRVCDGIDLENMRERFGAWLYDGGSAAMASGRTATDRSCT